MSGPPPSLGLVPIDETLLPAGLRREDRTKPGVWGRRSRAQIPSRGASRLQAAARTLARQGRDGKQLATLSDARPVILGLGYLPGGSGLDEYGAHGLFTGYRPVLRADQSRLHELRAL